MEGQLDEREEPDEKDGMSEMSERDKGDEGDGKEGRDERNERDDGDDDLRSMTLKVISVIRKDNLTSPTLTMEEGITSRADEGMVSIRTGNGLALGRVHSRWRMG